MLPIAYKILTWTTKRKNSSDKLYLQISSLIKMPGSHSSSIQSSPRSMRLVTSQDLYTSISATLTSKDNRPSTPVHHIQENDYTVPAPPPPSPVSFRPEHWPTSIRR